MFQKMLTAAAMAALMSSPLMAQSGKKSADGTAPVDVPDCAEITYSGGDAACRCDADPGRGSVWGSGPYTGDSNICAAAIHAGAISTEGGVVRLTEKPGQSSYEGSSANGVKTGSWGSYSLSFAVVGASATEMPAKSTLVACGTLPSGVDSFSCNCAPDFARGSVWGSDPYTTDSNICTAALHAYYIEESGGDVHVLRIQGLSAYTGSESSGVTTSDWGGYSSSFVFDWNQ